MSLSRPTSLQPPAPAVFRRPPYHIYTRQPMRASRVCEGALRALCQVGQHSVL
jgi:hypothetical protein